MARHNRRSKGLDQLGNLWHVSYQPDWFRSLKISLRRPGKRRSAITLCSNPDTSALSRVARWIRTRITSADGSVDFSVSLEDRGRVVEYITVGVRAPSDPTGDIVKFVVYGNLPQEAVEP